ncbi:MAG TPA: 50S ribosomal protein L22 [Saprospirales bacterium]|nr:50S ribosomal protein L22 [Saprospirales bacterium]HAY70457.1 50S ribosomal protein L22 [Saprospirales bacterium]HRQ28470.1 50S ribosomal protein L22 [Saprospiraceae bacterium]
MEAIARLRNVPMSARKMRLVVDLIRGKKVDEALNILKYNKKEASVWIEKLLLSAIANWEYKNDMTNSADEYGLIVKTAFVDEGTYLKRFRPAPHGRALPFRRKTNHTTIIVENKIALQAEVEEKEING